LARTQTCSKTAFRKCGIWPYNPEEVLAGLRAELEAAEQRQQAAATSAPPAADVAAVVAAAVAAAEEQQDAGSAGTALPELDPEVAAAAALQLLGLAGTSGEAAAAVMRGERKLAPKREGKGKKRLSYWVTGPEWEAQHQRELDEKQQKEAKAAKKAAATAKRELDEKQHVPPVCSAGIRCDRRQRLNCRNTHARMTSGATSRTLMYISVTSVFLSRAGGCERRGRVVVPRRQAA